MSERFRLGIARPRGASRRARSPSLAAQRHRSAGGLVARRRGLRGAGANAPGMGSLLRAAGAARGVARAGAGRGRAVGRRGGGDRGRLPLSIPARSRARRHRRGHGLRGSRLQRSRARCRDRPPRPAPALGRLDRRVARGAIPHFAHRDSRSDFPSLRRVAPGHVAGRFLEPPSRPHHHRAPRPRALVSRATRRSLAAGRNGRITG